MVWYRNWAKSIMRFSLYRVLEFCIQNFQVLGREVLGNRTAITSLDDFFFF